ncbi:2513_t:CDS:2, partial [Scutellospora calospora]
IFIYLQAIVNYRTAIRKNNPLLKRAAKRIFSPIWSARKHSIYYHIEVSDKIQFMQLDPSVRDIIEKNCVVSQSGFINQHQGQDAILEEINKALKTLIPPVLQMWHWKIAARNYNFINLTMDLKTTYNSLGEEYELSLQLIEFTNLAKQARREYITNVFINNDLASLFRPILITKQEAIVQTSEVSITKAEIVCKIEAFLEQLDESVQIKYRGIKSKNRSELLVILEEVRSLINNESNIENLEISESEISEVEHA